MMKITNEYLKEELEDIINCIVNFDHTETLEVKGRYFDIIQKDLKKLVKNNGVLDDVIVSGKDCKIPMRELGSDKCLICGKKFNEH